MKDKIEISQANLLDMMVEKVKFLTNEYINLHGSFEFDKKRLSKVQTDPVRITSSYSNFLKQSGDIGRLLQLYEMFNETPHTNTKKVAKQ